MFVFDRDVVVFGMDCRLRCRVMGGINRIKVYVIKYVWFGDEEDGVLLVVLIEDGRVLFFDMVEENC